MRYLDFRALLAAAGVLTLGLPSNAEAQLQRMRSAQEATVGVELTKGFFEGSDLSFYTSVVRGRVLAPISDGVAFLGEWGLSIAGSDGFGSDATLSNPELGLAFLDDDARSKGYVSVIMPIARGFGDGFNSVQTAVLTDFNWFERFSDDTWSVNAAVTPSPALSEGGATRLDLELVGSALIPRGGGDAELLSRYVVGLSHSTGTVRLRADVEGLAILSEGDLSLSERTIHQIVVGMNGVDGGPGFFLRIPVDDQMEGVDLTLGATFTF